MRWLDVITDLMAMNLWKLQKLVMDKDAWFVAVHDNKMDYLEEMDKF